MGENDENEVGDQAAERGGDRPNRDESNIPVPILERIGHPACSDDECGERTPQNPIEKFRDRIERWRTIIELALGVLTLILTIVLAGATVVLALDNRKLVKDTAASIVEMENANRESVRANDIARDALDQMKANSKIELRAYLYTTKPRIEFRPEKPPQFFLAVGNSGQTPAHSVIIRARAYYGITPAQKERVGEFTWRRYDVGIPGAGAQAEELKIGLIKTPVPDNFDRALDAKPAKDGSRNINRRTLRVEGEILYRTVFTLPEEPPESVQFDYGIVLEKSKDIAPGKTINLRLDYPGKENESTHGEGER